jgi:hypothetical protein
VEIFWKTFGKHLENTEKQLENIWKNNIWGGNIREHCGTFGKTNSGTLGKSLLLYNSSLQEIAAIISEVRTYTTMSVGILATMAKARK